MSALTAKDRLLENVPPEQRAYFARCLDRLTTNPNDPFFAFFAILAESYRTSAAVIGTKLAALEQRENQRDSQLAKDRSENVKTIRQEIGAFTEDKFWKRVIRSKIAGGITFAVCWVVGSYLLINSQIGAVKTSVDDLKVGQTATLAQMSDNPQGIVDFANASIRAATKSNDTASMLAGIAAILKTPDATIGMREGKLTLKIRSEHVTIKRDNEFTFLRIHEEMPAIFGRIEDHLDDADKALQPKQR
jgi:hypothetical protein